MTQIEWDQLVSAIERLTPEEQRKIRALLRTASASKASESPACGLWGLFADEEEVLDRTLEFAYQRRELPLRSL